MAKLKDSNANLLNAQEYLPNAIQLHSPHQDDRPLGVEVDLLVIHGISLPKGEFGNDAVIQLFMGILNCDENPGFSEAKGLRVSAHLFIRRNGELFQFVPFSKRAWHAGISSFEGRAACNDFSVGIELEGADEIPYTDQQYAMLIQTIESLYLIFPKLKRDRIVGHHHIAPLRKTDPGISFNWSILQGLSR